MAIRDNISGGDAQFTASVGVDLRLDEAVNSAGALNEQFKSSVEYQKLMNNLLTDTADKLRNIVSIEQQEVALKREINEVEQQLNDISQKRLTTVRETVSEYERMEQVVGRMNVLMSGSNLLRPTASQSNVYAYQQGLNPYNPYPLYNLIGAPSGGLSPVGQSIAAGGGGSAGGNIPPGGTGGVGGGGGVPPIGPIGAGGSSGIPSGTPGSGGGGSGAPASTGGAGNNQSGPGWLAALRGLGQTLPSSGITGISSALGALGPLAALAGIPLAGEAIKVGSHLLTGAYNTIAQPFRAGQEYTALTGGTGVAGAEGYNLQALIEGMNPLLGYGRAKQIIQMGLQQGYANSPLQGQWNQFAVGNAENYGVSPQESMKIFQAGVMQAGASTAQLSAAMAQLAGIATTTGGSFQQMQQNLTSNLTSFGQVGATGEAAVTAGTIVGSMFQNVPALRNFHAGSLLNSQLGQYAVARAAGVSYQDLPGYLYNLSRTQQGGEKIAQLVNQAYSGIFESAGVMPGESISQIMNNPAQYRKLQQFENLYKLPNFTPEQLQGILYGHNNQGGIFSSVNAAAFATNSISHAENLPVPGSHYLLPAPHLRGQQTGTLGRIAGDISGWLANNGRIPFTNLNPFATLRNAAENPTQSEIYSGDQYSLVNQWLGSSYGHAENLVGKYNAYIGHGHHMSLAQMLNNAHNPANIWEQINSGKLQLSTGTKNFQSLADILGQVSPNSSQNVNNSVKLEIGFRGNSALLNKLFTFTQSHSGTALGNSIIEQQSNNGITASNKKNNTTRSSFGSGKTNGS